MSPATYARVDQLHRQDLLAHAARASALGEAKGAVPEPIRPAARARSVLRHAAAAVAAVGVALGPR